MNNIGKHRVHLKGENFTRIMTVYKYGGKDKHFVHKPGSKGGTEKIFVVCLPIAMDENNMNCYEEVDYE